MMSETRNRKSLLWTYVFWAMGGFFGLHQIYLGRFRHAFALWISMGGYFGIGLIRELWRIPEYVRDVNEDPKYLEDLIVLMRKKPKPSYSIVRYLASIIVSDILGYLVMGAIPYELFSKNNGNKSPISYLLITILVPFACAFGVHLVGNVGRFSGSFKWPLFAAYLTAPAYLFDINAVFFTSLLSLIFYVMFSLQWRRSPTSIRQNNFQRYGIFLACVLLYLSLWTSWFYFNCTITDKNEETIKCRQAVTNFFNSPAWLEFRTVVGQLIEFIKKRGFWGLWNEIVDALDPQGEKNALRILELSENATQKDITFSYRRLAKLWHPDKHHTKEEKRQAQEKFLVIQGAYDLLSQMKQKRVKRNS